MKRGGYLILTLGLVTALAMVPASAMAHREKSRAINPGDFVGYVDNKFFPLRPGTTFYYEGTKEGIPASNVMFVTHETKEILGITTIVVRDRAFEEGVLVEETFDWYAQDREGNEKTGIAVACLSTVEFPPRTTSSQCSPYGLLGLAQQVRGFDSPGSRGDAPVPRTLLELNPQD